MDVKALRAKMVLRGMSVYGLAERIGIDSTTLYKKLRGATEFTQSEISKIANVLGMSREEILAVFFAEEVSYKPLSNLRDSFKQPHAAE